MKYSKLKQFGKWVKKQLIWLLIMVFIANFFGIFFQPKTARAANPNMMLFWDGGAAPAGWSFVDDGAGEAFYNDGVNNVFPRGNSSYGRMAGGTATHTHTVTPTAPSGAQVGGTGRKTTASAGTVTLNGHDHHTVSGTASVTTTSNLPAYRNLRVIQYSGIPTTIPSGAIAIFDAAAMPNADWDSYSATQGTNYVSALSTSGGTGGSNSHAGAGHTVTNLTLDTNTDTATLNGTTANYNTLNHTHTACNSGNVTDTPTTEPPYVNVLLGKTNKDTTTPSGMVAMFDGTGFTEEWEILSDSGGPFYQKFLKSAASYSAGAGADPTHSHASLTCASSSVTSASNGGSGTANTGVSGSHTHNTTVAIDAAAAGATLPPYTNVVFARKSYLYFSLTANNAPNVGDTITVNSQVDNNSTTNLVGTHIKYIIFIDANADSLPTVGETYITAACAGSGAWASEADFTWEKTGLDVAAAGNATDVQSCTNNNFPSNSTYTIWGKWHNSTDTIIYDTKTVTFTSVPTLTEVLFMTLVGCAVFLGIRTGAIKFKMNNPRDEMLSDSPHFPNHHEQNAQKSNDGITYIRNNTQNDK